MNLPLKLQSFHDLVFNFGFSLCLRASVVNCFYA
jgi:hypothetical protein